MTDIPTNKVDKDVFTGSRLRLARKNKKITQASLGEALGVTFQQIQKYENGKNRISASKIYKAAQLLGVEPSFFFEAEQSQKTESAEYKEELARLIDIISSGDGLELNRCFQKIEDRHVRANIVSLVKALAMNDMK